ncbi:MAG: SGNH/GDSL hydrolase family protein [Halioglobus sp.]
MRIFLLLVTLTYLAGCVGKSLDPATASRDEALDLPWRVHCETEKTYGLDISAVPGIYSGRWVWGIDGAGETVFLEGDFEDGFFLLRSVASSTGEVIPATREGLRNTCLSAVANGDADTLARVMAGRDTRDINVPVVFPGDRSQEYPVNQMVLFGDSLTDTGRLKHRMQIFPGPPYWLGRFSNGPAWPDYLESGTVVAIQNNAYGGASVERPMDLDDGGLIAYAKEGGRFFVSGSLGQQTDVFVQETLSTDTVMKPDNTAFLVWGGANDYVSKEPVTGLITTFLDEPESELGYESVADTTVAGLISEVRTLYASGARRFVMVNMPDLGRTPIILQNESYAPKHSDDSDIGRRFRLSQRLTALADYHNEELALAVKQLNKELKGATVLLVDANSLTTNILDQRSLLDPSVSFDYGFSVKDLEERLTFNDEQLDLPKNCYLGAYLGSFIDSDSCENQYRAAFWDVLHPGTYAHCWQAYEIGRVLAEAGWVAPMPSMEDYRDWCQSYAAAD